MTPAPVKPEISPEDLAWGDLSHFDVIITAQQVRSYKPDPTHFLEARKRIGDSKWLHAAQSNRHDIVPANLLGIPSAWINRHAEKGGARPTYEFANLTELANGMT